jgi:hypothetical protein
MKRRHSMPRCERSDHGTLPEPRDTLSVRRRSAFNERVQRIAQLARAATWLSDTTKRDVLLRTEGALAAAEDHGSSSHRSSRSTSEQVNRLSSAVSAPGPLHSSHERLERLERSIADIRRAFEEVHRLTHRACKHFNSRGGR